MRLVLADDHEIVRAGLCKLIESNPDMKVVGEASTGRQAIELVRTQNPDVVIMDVSMPDLNGLEAARQIRRDFSGTRVIILTMHHKSQYIKDLLKAGISGYVLKQDIVSDLMAAIVASGKGEVYLSPKISGLLVADYVSDTPRDPSNTTNVLASREREILQLIAEGKTTKEIAAHLCISPKTVESTRRRIMQKLNLFTIAELTRYAIAEGIIAEE